MYGALLRDYCFGRHRRIFKGNGPDTTPQYASQKGRSARFVVTLTSGVLPLCGSQTEGTAVPGLWASKKFGEPTNQTKVLKQENNPWGEGVHAIVYEGILSVKM